MTDHSELVKRLRDHTRECAPQPLTDSDINNAADAIEAQAKRITRLEEMYTRWRDEPIKANNRIAELEAENVKLREALVKLNAAVDAFWNDPDRPSIAKMKSNSVYDVNEAQFRARAALGESDG